jgi:hypothetical protein
VSARSAGEIRADLADCDRDGLPWPSAARRLLGDIEPLLARLEAVKALHFPYDCTEAGNEGHESCGEREWCYSCGEGQPWPCTTFQALRDAALSAAPVAVDGCACGVTTEHGPHEFDLPLEPAPTRCNAQPPKGPNSWWMNDDQWEADLSRCLLDAGHDGQHNCEHNTPWTGEWRGAR